MLNYYENLDPNKKQQIIVNKLDFEAHILYFCMYPKTQNQIRKNYETH